MFVPVDINSIKLDAPTDGVVGLYGDGVTSGSATPTAGFAATMGAPAQAVPQSRFVPVDINSIKLDGAPQALMAAPDVPAPSGFAQRMAEDFQKRKDKFRPTADAYKNNEIGAGQYALQDLGQGAGLVGDVAGNVAGSVARYASHLVPTAVEEPIKNAGIRLLNYASDSAVGDVARDYANSYQGFAQENPNAARNIQSLANIGGLASSATPIKGVSAASAAVDTAGAVAKPVERAVVRGAEKLAIPKQVMPNSEQLANMGAKAYDAARASGEVFDAPSVSNKFVQALDAAKGKKIAGTVETDLSQGLESALGKYRQLADKPLGIDEVDIIDKDLSNLKDQAYNSGKNQLGSELSNIQNALRGSVAESPGGATLAEARDLFRRKYQMEDVERIFRNAEGRPNEAAIIQTGYRNLANQARKKGSGYSKEQIALMDKAAKGGLSIDALKLASSKLIPIAVGASGNGAGAGIAYMGNLAAGAGATALQTAKANKLAKSITKGITVEGEPTRLNRAAARLTKQDLQKAFEAKKKLQMTDTFLDMPPTPSAEQMKKFSTVQDVSLSDVEANQSKREFDKFNKGIHPEPLISGYSDLPVAVKFKNGKYLLLDGHHRTDLELNKGKNNVRMHVIEAKDYTNINRNPAKESKFSASDADLLEQLLKE